MDQYIGPNKVLGLVKQDLKTPSGGDVVEVQYEGEHLPEVMTQMAFDKLVTELPTAYSDRDQQGLSDRRFKLMTAEIIKVIMEWDIKMIELKPLLQAVGDSVQDGVERAGNYLWTHDERTWVPGMSFMNERTLLEAERVLKSIPRNKKDGQDDGSTISPGDASD